MEGEGGVGVFGEVASFLRVVVGEELEFFFDESFEEDGAGGDDAFAVRGGKVHGIGVRDLLVVGDFDPFVELFEGIGGHSGDADSAFGVVFAKVGEVHGFGSSWSSSISSET